MQHKNPLNTVVDLSNGNTYLASLFVSGVPCVFDGKMCARDEVIRVVHV